MEQSYALKKKNKQANIKSALIFVLEAYTQSGSLVFYFEVVKIL
jgi:hypothetical protein